MNHKTCLSWTILIACCFLAPHSAAGPDETPVPVDAEFQVNQGTTDFQGNPKVAARNDGSFIVVWESDAADDGDIFLRIFDSAGMALTDDVQVNTYTTGEQGWSRAGVAPFEDGSFVVVWDGGDIVDGYPLTSVYGRLFDSAGMASTPQFELSTSTSRTQLNPSVATSPDGRFMTAWSDMSTGYDSIQMRRWNSDGTPIAAEIQVNVETSLSAGDPEIAYSSNGEFVVVWQQAEESIEGRRFDTLGAPVGEPFQISTLIDDQDTPALATAEDGGFVVTWRSYSSLGTDQSETSTQARIYGSDAAPVGEPFQVNTFTTSYNDDARVSFDFLDTFIVVWESEPLPVEGSSSPDGSDDAVRGQRFSKDGTLEGDEFAVNGLIEGSQSDPDIAVIGPERAVIVFESATSAGTDLSNDSIQARIFDLCPGPNDLVDADEDLIPDDCDLCQGDNATGDKDQDGVCNDLDQCLGDDSSGDGDNDGICADRDCNDQDGTNACAVFGNGFETGDTSAWAQTFP